MRFGKCVVFVLTLFATAQSLFSQTSPAEPASLVPNGSFETDDNQDGVPDGWGVVAKNRDRQHPEVTLTTEQHVGGTQCVKMTGRTGGVFQTFLTPLTDENRRGPFLVDLHAMLVPAGEGINTGEFRLLFSCIYTDGTRRYEGCTVSDLRGLTAEKGWQHLRGLWTPAKPVQKVEVRFSYVGDDAAYLDDVVIAPIRREPFFPTVKLAEELDPYVGTQWTRTADGWKTDGPCPPGGWYLKSRHAYALWKLSLDVRRDGPDGIVYVHTPSWRILLRPDRVTAKTARGWTYYFNTDDAPIDFSPGRAHRFEMELDGEALVIRWDGAEAMRFSSPQEVWGPRIAGAGKFSGDQPQFHERLPSSLLDGAREWVVFQVLGSPVAFSDISLRGLPVGEPDGFYTERFINAPRQCDCDIRYLAPVEPVDVTWTLDGQERDKAAALPAVKNWKMKPVPARDHFGAKNNNAVKNAEVFVGADKPGPFPNALYVYGRAGLQARGINDAPQSASIYFNLAQAGPYTLQIGWGTWHMGWGPNVFEVSVDGRCVSRNVFRALLGNSGGPPGFCYVPLNLPAGPHRIDLKLADPARMGVNRFYSKYLAMPTERVELVPGIHEPIREIPAWQPQPEQSLIDPGSVGEVSGRIVRYLVTDLSPGPCDVTLGFFELDVAKPGQRLMDVYLNGQKAASDVDIVADAGVQNYVTRSYAAESVELPFDPHRVAFWENASHPARPMGMELTDDAHGGKRALKLTGNANGTLRQKIMLNQTEPKPLLLRWAVRVQPRPDGKPYAVGYAMLRGSRIDGKEHNVGIGILPDTRKEGWQELRQVLMPREPLRYVYVEVRPQTGVELWLDDVELYALDRPDPADAEGKSNLVVNGGFEAPSYGIDVRLVGKNFKAFLNRLTIAEAETGGVVFDHNCGWMERIHKRMFGRPYQPAMYEGTPADPKRWAEPSEMFDGHNVIANPHFSLVDEKTRRPVRWQGALGQGWLKHYGVLQGDGEWTADAAVGHDAPGAMRVGKTAGGFAVVSDVREIDYGKQQTFSFWAKGDKAAGKVSAEILWFAGSSIDNGLRGAPSLRLLVRSQSSPVAADGTWRQVQVTARPPFAATHAICAVRVDDNAAGKIWIDDAELNGYGSEPLEISYCPLGYHPLGSRRIVVRSLEKAPVRWELLSEGGQTSQTGQAAYHSYEWFSKRHYYTFDLPDGLKGSYKLRATQGAAAAETPAFDVSPDIYRRLAAVSLHGLYVKRFNCEIPGAIEPGAMEDAHAHLALADPRFAPGEVRYSGAQRDTTGGYFDAGDEMKHIEFWPAALTATRELWKATANRPLTDRGADDALAEMLWAYAALPKMIYRDGSVYTSCKAQMKATDNIPFHGEDRHIALPKPVGQVAGALAMGAWDLREIDPALSAVCLVAALKNYNQAWNLALQDDPVQAAQGLWAEMYLWKLTGERLYAERMARHARMVASALQQRRWRGQRDISHNGGLERLFAWVPCKFVELYPDHPASPLVLDGLRAFADDVAAASAQSPWGQARDISSTDPAAAYRWPGPERFVSYWSTLAYALSRIGLLLKDPEIIRLAERQLQWNLGANCCDLSMIHGVGDRWVAGGDFLFMHNEFVNHWLASERKLYGYDGCVPTLAWRHIGKGEHYPQGYYHYYLQGDYPIHPGPTEFYLPLASNLALGVAGVLDAMDKLPSLPEKTK